MKIAIVGLGYVGLPLSLQFARSGVNVLGLDVDPAKIEALNAGRSFIKHIESSAIAEHVKAKMFEASADFSRIKVTGSEPVRWDERLFEEKPARSKSGG